MKQFIDIHTGKVFCGDKPYVFWFGEGQSTHMIYSMPLCFISENETENISIEDTGVFFLVDESGFGEKEDIGGVEYCDLERLKTKNIVTYGIEYDGSYIHVFYIITRSESEGQNVTWFRIGDDEFEIGADFYNEDESLLINLANQGQEIPESVQRAIYSSNVHEELNDNILLNRKWKELILNSWDTFVCKGSYKSLINTLKWFEYGDIIKLSEYWKNSVVGKTWLAENELTSILSKRYADALTNFAKTTYIGIHCALEKTVRDENGSMVYTDGMDRNPSIEKVALKWTQNDMGLKMALLGNFYESYFMPIHLDLIHSTIEDIVYTTAIKDFETIERLSEQYVYHLDTFDCSVKDGDEFTITNANVQVGPKTLFANRYTKDWDEKIARWYDELIWVDSDIWRYKNGGYGEVETIGVEAGTYDRPIENDDDLKTFWAQNLNYTGTVVPFECRMELDDKDVVTEEILSFKNGRGKSIIVRDNQIMDVIPPNGTTHDSNMTIIKFNLYYEKPGQKSIVVQFRTAGGRTYTKRLNFNVLDNGIPCLGLYKIVSNKEPFIGFEMDPYMEPCYTQFGTMSLRDERIYKQFLPCAHGAIGIRKNHLLVFVDPSIDNRAVDNEYIKENYMVFTKDTSDTDPQKYYSICVSKFFDFVPDKSQLPDNQILRDDYIFFPEFHHLEPFGTSETDIRNYIATNSDTLVMVPWFNNGSMGSVPLKYTRDIKEPSWIFKNMTTGQEWEYPAFRNLVLADDKNKMLDPGYYTVVFRYMLNSEKREITYNSCMIVSHKK